MPRTLTYSGQLVVVTCWCGIHHAVPAELRDYQARQHRDGVKQTGIYCPLGHTWISAGEGEAAVLQRELERKRAGAGVCPCCNRTFKQLARHMETKHPDFDPEGAAR